MPIQLSENISVEWRGPVIQIRNTLGDKITLDAEAQKRLQQVLAGREDCPDFRVMGARELHRWLRQYGSPVLWQTARGWRGKLYDTTPGQPQNPTASAVGVRQFSYSSREMALHVLAKCVWYRINEGVYSTTESG